MGLIKLTKQEAERIEYLLDMGHTKEQIIDGHHETLLSPHFQVPMPTAATIDPLINLSVSKLARALYEGYEVEETPFDLLRRHLLEEERFPSDELNQAYLQGARLALDIFDISVANINSDKDAAHKR